MTVHRLRIYRFISIFLICLLIVSCTSLAMAFADTKGHWAEEAIDRWSEEYGIFIGSEGLFRPNSDITRAEMAVLLDRILGYQAAGDFTFEDVSDEAWYAAAVAHLHEAGVMLGDGRLANPKRTVTREQAVTMLARAFAVNTSRGLAGALQYDDSAKISDWAFASVGAMTALGYIQGTGSSFHPADNLTRAECVTIFDNMISRLYTEGGVYTDDVMGNALIQSERGIVLRNMTIHGNLYIAYNVEVPVTLVDTEIEGEIVNFSGIEPVRFDVVQDSGADPAEVEGPFITYEGHQVPILEDVAKNPYDEALFSRDEKGRIIYSSDLYDTRVGIDVSAWQNEIDWSRVAEQGIDFAMLRVGYRGYSAGTLNEDACFRQNIRGALAAGLDVGVYFFSQAISAQEALEEAQFVLDCIAGYPITYPVVFDWEPIADTNARTNGLSTDILCDAANTFCGAVQSAGYTPMVYFNLYAGYLRYDLSRIDQYDFWLAQYTETPGFYYNFQMWQYTSGGTVAGIEGGVDMILSFVNYAERP